jgi:hypothetical protein
MNAKAAALPRLVARRRGHFYRTGGSIACHGEISVALIRGRHRRRLDV